MHEELINSLRICGDWTEQVRLVGRDCCDGCKYQKDGVCESFKGNKELLLIEAADAIESMCEMVATAYCENANIIASYEESKPRWIPVTERLPGQYGTYLVTTARGSVMVCCYYPKAQNWNTRATVAYWQPLPEPPKEETE